MVLIEKVEARVVNNILILKFDNMDWREQNYKLRDNIIEAVEDLQSEITQLAGIIFDLQQLDTIYSSVITAIVYTKKRFSNNQQNPLRIVAVSASDKVKTVWEIAHMNLYYPLFDTLNEATDYILKK
jgi:anti-anti-sigma regulatory factor